MKSDRDETLTAFFMWCTTLDVGIYILAAIVVVAAPDFVYRIHSRWFGLSREAFDVAVYGYLALFKIVIVVFHLVPYLALLIMS